MGDEERVFSTILIVNIEATGGGGGWGWMRAHLDRPSTLPAPTPVAREAPRLLATIKGCLPTGETRAGGQPGEPPRLITASKTGTQSPDHTL